jgi:hypothetical protein
MTRRIKYEQNCFFNIISEIIILTLIYTAIMIYDMYHFAREPFYVIVIQIINRVPDICKALILLQFINLVFIVKQR